MAAAFVQALFSGNNKSANTSFQITGSLSVTLGNDIFVGVAMDTGGSAHQCADNLGNTYTIEEEINNSGNVRVILFRATVTSAGTLTSQTISWTTNVTAKAAASGEFSGVGPRAFVGGGQTGTATPITCVNSKPAPPDGVAIGVAGIETDGAPGGWTSSTGEPLATTPLTVGTANTTGGGAASNVGVHLAYTLGSATGCAQLLMKGGGIATVDAAGCGATYFASGSPQSGLVNDPTDDSGIGTVAWTNPGDGTGSNNVYAAVTLTAGQTSHYLKTVGYNFDIPSGQQIAGIKVTVECKQALVLTQSLSVRLLKAGTVQTAETKTAEVPTTEGEITFGGSTDLWTNSWAVSDIEDANFGCVCWVDNALADTYSVDNIFISVYYEAAAGRTSKNTRSWPLGEEIGMGWRM